MRCSRVVESCGSKWFQSALTATKSTTSLALCAEPLYTDSVTRLFASPHLGSCRPPPSSAVSHCIPADGLGTQRRFCHSPPIRSCWGLGPGFGPHAGRVPQRAARSCLLAKG